MQKDGKKQVITVLQEMMPRSLAAALLEYAGIAASGKAAELPKADRQNLLRVMKGLNLHIQGLRGFRDAMVTQGGVDVAEVDPVTMESLLVSGLRFAGEVLDLDALTGGYNLQIAWSTGRAAGSFL